MSWLRKFVRSKAKSTSITGQQAPSPENCAIWHDISRALDAKPRSVK
jgi:hypothetical protein